MREVYTTIIANSRSHKQNAIIQNDTVCECEKERVCVRVCVCVRERVCAGVCVSMGV